MTPVNPNALTHSPLDRASHLRRDAAWLEEALASDDAKLVAYYDRQPLLAARGDSIEVVWLGGHARARIAPPEMPVIFLGIAPDKSAYFAIEVSDPKPLEGLGSFHEMRGAAAQLNAEDISILGCAKSLFEWHSKHGFCAKCGAATNVVEAGWKRECPVCKSEHFPRVDPVVIMVPCFGDKMALGRQRVWPKGMYSALAGFLEPGETIEQAVARETLEESGLVVSDVQYHSTQPWPFPSTLMIGALCTVEHDRDKVDQDELESVRWFSREEARQLVAGKHPECFAPPPFAIAHQLIKTWSESEEVSPASSRQRI